MTGMVTYEHGRYGNGNSALYLDVKSGKYLQNGGPKMCPICLIFEHILDDFID